MPAAVPPSLERNHAPQCKVPLEARQRCLSLSLARWAKKRRPLCLDDPLHLAAGPAARAGVAGVVVHAVMILIAACLVERVAIRAVAERRAFVADGRFEDGVRRVGDRLPLGARDLVAAAGRVDVGQVQNLGRVQVADAGHGPLVEQRHLHRPACCRRAARETIRPSSPGHRARVSPGQTPLRTPSAKTGEHFPARGGPNTEARAMPLPGERAAKPQMLAARRIGHQHQPGHPRLEHDRVARIQIARRRACRRGRRRESCGRRRGGESDRSAARSRSAGAGRRRARRRRIREPTMPKMPRRIVSTSGSSGI